MSGNPGTLPDVPWGFFSSWCSPAGLEKMLATICLRPGVWVVSVEEVGELAGAQAPKMASRVRKNEVLSFRRHRSIPRALTPALSQRERELLPRALTPAPPRGRGSSP